MNLNEEGDEEVKDTNKDRGDDDVRNRTSGRTFALYFSLKQSQS